MSTRCYIVKKLQDGSFKGIYCHSDGYLEFTGLKLYSHYRDEKALDKLLELGDLSFLGDVPEDDPKLWTRKIDLTTYEYDYDSNKCKTYKGRVDVDVDARISDNLEDFLIEDFTYVWNNGHYDVYTFDVYIGELEQKLRKKELIK